MTPSRRRVAAVCALAAASCGTQGPPPPAPPLQPAPPTVVPEAAPEAAPQAAPRWLRGSTHVHARPSGDSSAEIPDVIAWYEQRGYDFIVLTDHNRVSEVSAAQGTAGAPAVRVPADGRGLIVLAGIELTHNPATCEPPPPAPDGRCRVHVNAIGVTARPSERLEWAERQSALRLDQYTRALHTARQLGGLAQLNHPQWHWGMSAELLAQLAGRGALLVEIANAQFARWNAGAPPYPSMDELWDAALATGVTLWGVASDDAHSYDGAGPYPAGGGWVMVQAEREPAAILAALAAGQFYSSTGVALSHAGPVGEDLVVEVAAESPGAHRVAFFENGALVAEREGPRASWPVPARGFVRAVVTRQDGARAWVQPARRAPGR